MRILGVDPGTVVVGFGVVETQAKGYRVLDFGCLKFSSRQPFPQRLKSIYDGLTDIIVKYRPDACAIENLFYAENAKVAIKMGHARGVAILAAVNKHIPTSEYTPREIKQSVVGNGAASKLQVQKMVQQLLNLSEAPEPFDAADALAIALCHVHRMENPR